MLVAALLNKIIVHANAIVKSLGALPGRAYVSRIAHFDKAFTLF